MVPLWKNRYGNFTGLLKNVPYDDVIKVSTILIPRQSEYESTTKPIFEYETNGDLFQMCNEMDNKIVQALYATGGAEYATISSLAWRY